MLDRISNSQRLMAVSRVLRRPVALIIALTIICAGPMLVILGPAMAFIALLLVDSVGLLLLIYFKLVRAEQASSEMRNRAQVNTVRQMQSLLYLYSALQLRRPLPPLSDMAISPDFASTLANLIFEIRPNLVFELGSGCSTLVAGYCLSQLGKGSIVSIDHEARFASQSRNQIAEHGLECTAIVTDAPLRPVQLSRGVWQWYGLDGLSGLPPIDLLVVDGPPAWTGPLARYPALPQLMDRLSPSAVVLLDDANRPDEQEAVRLWLQEFPDFVRQDLPCEKGAILLRRVANRKQACA